MKTNTKPQIPYYAVDDPFDIVYRNSAPKTVIVPHIHNALEVYYTLTDLPDVLLNNTVSSVPKGSLIVIPPYNIHQLFHQSQTVYERYIISVNCDWLQTVFRSPAQQLPYAVQSAPPAIVSLSLSHQTMLLDGLQHFFQAPKSRSAAYFSAFFQLLQTLDACISDNPQPQKDRLQISKSQELVNEMIAYVNSHLDEPLSLEQISAHFFMNKDYLARLFKAHTQATIGHYIALQKVRNAQRLLSEGKSVTQVQEALGFSSYSYFFKFFKKMTGISPSHYQKKM